MEPYSALEMISKEKIHHFFALIPLISFILYKVTFWIIFFYTIFFAIWEVYIYCLITFGSESVEVLIKPPKTEKKMSIIEQWKFLRKKLFFIPHLLLFIFTSIIITVGFIYSFCLVILHFNENLYNFLLLLAHVFLSSFMVFLLLVFRYYRKVISKKQNENPN